MQENQKDDEDLLIDELVFIPVAGPSRGCQGATSEPSRQIRSSAVSLDDNEDSRVEVVNQNAGAVYGEGRTVREAWRKHFSESQGTGSTGVSAGYLTAGLTVKRTRHCDRGI